MIYSGKLGQGQSQGQGGDGGSAAAGQRAGGHRIAQGLGHRGHWV